MSSSMDYRLSQIARLLLHELGSAMAQNLHYRSSWYFITQKGISGFSPYEDAHFVVIEEGVLLGPDFLAYLGQLLPLLDMDSTISSISAWNDNGKTLLVVGVSGNNKRLFRVESLTGMGFLVRRGFPAETWCERRFALEGSPSGGDTISPDVSRVMRISDLVYNDETTFSEAIGALLSQERVTDMELGVTIEGVETLERSHYEKVLHGMLSTYLGEHIALAEAQCALLEEQLRYARRVLAFSTNLRSTSDGLPDAAFAKSPGYDDDDVFDGPQGVRSSHSEQQLASQKSVQETNTDVKERASRKTNPKNLVSLLKKAKPQNNVAKDFTDSVHRNVCVVGNGGLPKSNSEIDLRAASQPDAASRDLVHLMQ
ncbi:hypothetical protein HPB52_004261 [Rhipicephalus sanguineus]|uniref:Alpha-1,3-mannosyl-glycoprotein 2-beta-N-acetylglucosaminyltransferase n=1 Tax=Rhipicephalus sanguineus TaxID=34632 RepID=A0A9D4PLY9_RHISA|nr:hypothetical protein HPB52_004261 [Rhipicephalus sanguineus]